MLGVLWEGWRSCRFELGARLLFLDGEAGFDQPECHPTLRPSHATLPPNTDWAGISAGGGVLLRGAGVDFTFGPRGALPPRGGLLHHGR